MSEPTKKELEALQIKIAELMGWVQTHEAHNRKTHEKWPVWSLGALCASIKTGLLPNYPASLDLMHAAEETLTGDEWGKYCKALERIVRNSGNHLQCWRVVNPSRVIDALQMHAEAHQKAAAFIQAKEEA